MQFQHGKYETFDNGSLILTPFGVDGRQLLSDPCNNVDSVYTRYIQIEQFKASSTLSPFKKTSIPQTPSNNPPIEIRSPPRQIQQYPTPQPLRLRWRPAQPHAPRLPTPPNAPHPDPKPDLHRHGWRRPTHRRWCQSEAQPRARHADAHEQVRPVAENAALERGSAVVVRSQHHRARRRGIFLFLSTPDFCLYTPLFKNEILHSRSCFHGFFFCLWRKGAEFLAWILSLVPRRSICIIKIKSS